VQNVWRRRLTYYTNATKKPMSSLRCGLRICFVNRLAHHVRSESRIATHAWYMQRSEPKNDGDRMPVQMMGHRSRNRLNLSYACCGKARTVGDDPAPLRMSNADSNVGSATFRRNDMLECNRRICINQFATIILY
jgi:hypothetical protein